MEESLMITVLLCSYNGEQYIEEQLKSILDQTVKDLHVVVSDDGSTDRTLEIVEKLSDENPGRITIIRQDPPNGSAAVHFLKLFCDKKYDFSLPTPDKKASEKNGLSEVLRADYIMLSDQDDVWKPEKAEKTLAMMKEMEAKYGKDTPLLVHCDAEVVDESLHQISPSYTAYQKMTPSRKHLNQLLVQNNVVGGATMVNRSLAGCVKKVPEHCVMHDEWLALIASAFGEIGYIPEALYYYRQHGDNVLGADKGSRIREILGRFGLFRTDGKSKADMDAHSRSVYREMFLQAECFLRMYGRDSSKNQDKSLSSDHGDESSQNQNRSLSEEQRKLLRAFISIPKKNRLGKILTILRYGFTYNLLHRTVGECL